MSKKQTYFFGFLFIVFVIGFFIFVKREGAEKSSFPVGINIGEKVYRLEIAHTDAELSKGLGKRNDLCSECGMLFLFDIRGKYAFWMKDMRFPIDIIWILDDEVVFVEHNIQPESQDILKPQVIANKVLEINVDKEQKIRVGEKIQFLYEK